MLPTAFVLQKWPKRHAHVVEECATVDVRDTISAFVPPDPNLRPIWQPAPEFPWLRLVARIAGPFWRWWFLCPSCQRHCETLFLPPGAPQYQWRCRACWNLVYASQRYG